VDTVYYNPLLFSDSYCVFICLLAAAD